MDKSEIEVVTLEMESYDRQGTNDNEKSTGYESDVNQEKQIRNYDVDFEDQIPLLQTCQPLAAISHEKPWMNGVEKIDKYLKDKYKHQQKDSQRLEERIRHYVKFLERNIEQFANIEASKPNLLHVICKYYFEDENLIKDVVRLFSINQMLDTLDVDDSEPLHVAARFRNYYALKVLLKYLDKSTWNRYRQGSTAYEMLIWGTFTDSYYTTSDNRKLTPEEIEQLPAYKDACNCLKLLLDRAVDVNRRNFDEESSIELAAQFGFKKMVEIILNNGKQPVDIDTTYFDRKSARELMREGNLYPNDSLPEASKYEMKLVDQLFQQLRFKDEAKFLEILNNAEATYKKQDDPANATRRSFVSLIDKDNQSYTLLQLACKLRLLKAVKALLQCGVNPNRVIRQNGEAPINIGLTNNPDDAVSLKITSQLLKRGAFLNTSNMVAEYLRKYFDKSCVKPLKPSQIYNGDSSKDILITYDFHALLCPQHYVDPHEKSARTTEMDVIEYLATTSKLRELLQHPLITVFLYLKWYIMRWFFYGSVGIFSGLTLSLFFYIHNSITSEANVSRPILTAFIFIMLVKECVEISILKSKYIISSTIGDTSTLVDLNAQNFFEFGLGLFVAFILMFDCMTDVEETFETRKLFYIVAVLLASGGLLQSFEQLPYVNYQISMLKKVGYNIFKTLLLYTIIFFAFAFSFTILYKESSPKGSTGTKLNPTEVLPKKAPEEKPIFFSNLLFSVYKMIVMMTGEFDMNDTLDFNKYPVESSILFLLFIFFVVLVCFNLLIGLAVSDIQAIRKDAELLSLLARWQHIRYVELLLEPFSVREKFLVSREYGLEIVVNVSKRAEFVPNVRMYYDRSTNLSLVYKILSFFHLDIWHFTFGKKVQQDTMLILQEQRHRKQSVDEKEVDNTSLNLQDRYNVPKFKREDSVS